MTTLLDMNVPMEGLLLSGFVVCWVASMLGSAIRLIVRSFDGGDPKV